MPIPTPNTGEKKQEFIDRCMGNETMKEDYPDRDQRLAICYDRWRADHGDSDMRKKGFSIRAKETDVEIYLYDEIGSGWFGGVSAKEFKDELVKIGKREKITVRINSPGGDVFDGLAIYNLLKQNQAKVTVYIDGLAASIASVIAMSGNEIHVPENAMLMIHQPWTMALGNAQEMRDVADRLEKVGNQLTNIYAKRSGMDEEKIIDMMAAETWMTGAEALGFGFADYLIDELPMAAHFDMTKFQYRNMPIQSVEEPEPKSQSPKPDLSCFDSPITRCKKILKFKE